MRLKQTSKLLLGLILTIVFNPACSQLNKNASQSDISSQDDGVPQEALDYLDDQPNSCSIPSYFPDGESHCDVLEKVDKKPDESCVILKQNEMRLNLPKTLKEIDGFEIKSDEPDRRRMSTKKFDIFDSPNGKMIDTYKENSIVLIEGRKGDWVLLRGYWSRPCDAGWALEKNLKTTSRRELETLGLFGR